MRVHRIASDVMLDLGYSSKLDRGVAVLLHAARRGPQVRERIPRRAREDLGVRSTFDVDTELEGM